MEHGSMRTVPLHESLKVEFKSDVKRLSDDELSAAVVCLANTEGGEIYIGVEDDGTITGLHPMHQNATSLSALIANGTNPPQSVRCVTFQEEGQNVARIEVPKSDRLVATSKGLLQRRRIQANGKPECIPFYPPEFMSRQSDLGVLDYSALPVTGAQTTDLNPLERERLRQLIAKYGGDRYLVGLSDDELDGALGLIRRENDHIVPTAAGLLILGREAALRQHLPTHEIAFQVLQGTDVKVNEFYRAPLLWVFERVIDQFTARVSEDEMQFGLFRVPVPDYDLRAFREAFVNALVHRDYTRLNAIYIQWKDEGCKYFLGLYPNLSFCGRIER
jgi:ATP-dependent DNA helicase RecG